MKKTLRKQIINQRKLISSSQLQAYDDQFYISFKKFFETYRHHYKPKVIGGYCAINNEFNIYKILDYCRLEGFQTALPLCNDQNKSLVFHQFNGDYATLKPDAYQIPAPYPKSPITVPDLIICPSVGVCSASFKRLGYGGGFFDRYAEKYPHIHFVGGFLEFQIIDNNLMFDTHDLEFFQIFNFQTIL